MTAPTMAAPRTWPGYGVPSGSYPAPPVRHTSHLRLLVMLGVGLLVVAAAMVVVSVLITPPPPSYHCPPDCGGPPSGSPLAPAGVVPPPGAPVQSFPRFTAGSGQFSVAYPRGVTVPADATGVNWSDKDGSTVSLFGRPAGNQTPRDIAESLIQNNIPGAEFGYEIPNAMLGYQPGYGEIDDFYPQAPTSSATHWRVLVMVSVKNDFAVIAAATGPSVSSNISNHPSGADMLAAFQISEFVNRFMWRGDPPR